MWTRPQTGKEPPHERPLAMQAFEAYKARNTSEQELTFLTRPPSSKLRVDSPFNQGTTHSNNNNGGSVERPREFSQQNLKRVASGEEVVIQVPAQQLQNTQETATVTERDLMGVSGQLSTREAALVAACTQPEEPERPPLGAFRKVVSAGRPRTGGLRQGNTTFSRSSLYRGRAVLHPEKT